MNKRYEAKESEPKWQKYWEKNKIFQYNPESKAEVYSVDTPPPTVSGKMHLGHAFSYSQQDTIVRFHRMRGKNVFFPFGTDDNGLATERLIEKTKKIRAMDMSRKEFVKLCLDTLEKELRPEYISDWKKIGMSCQWDMFYTTINEHCQKISQREFINLHKMGRAYRKDAPAMWCPECHTGISQVECEDKEMDSTFNDIIFKVDGKELIIATTRPELLPACVAVFYHPDDKRYKPLKGKKAIVPLFNFEVPIMEDERVDMEKGTGIVMCCTFGDQTDMEWQRAYDLPIKQAIDEHGKMTDIAEDYAGMNIKAARKHMIEDMKEEGLLVNQKPIKHMVNVHERCGTEIEFIKSKQWFIKYLDLRDKMLEWGNKLKWHPEHMKNRYDNWVRGLQWDWLISRQRYFGIPFPVWYCEKCGEPVFAKEKNLPVDPLKDKPPVDKCPKCGHDKLIPEKDVLDTWATSSLTPRLAVELMPEKEWDKLFPMDLRPQAHDIITFWLFNTTVRSNMQFDKNPWEHCMISGWALDPKGRKMSKSKGNTIEPQKMIEKYSADCLRYWAATAKLGEDVPFQEKSFVTAKKLINKLWNASKFVLMHLEKYDGKKPEKIESADKWMLSKLSKTIKEATRAFEEYEFSEARRLMEKLFWNFCDNYLELIKDRIYNEDREGKQSALYTLNTILLSILKMFAPIIPHITEEIYHAKFADQEGKKSIHISKWPEYDKTYDAEEEAGDLAIEILAEVRKYKSENQISLGKEIEKVKIKMTKENKKKINSMILDLKATAKVKEIIFKEGDNLEVSF